MLSCTWLLRDMTHAPKWTLWPYTYSMIGPSSTPTYHSYTERGLHLPSWAWKKVPLSYIWSGVCWGGWLSDSEVELQECWTRIYVLGPLSDLSHHHTRHQVTLKHNGYSETTLNTPLCFSERGCTISLPSWAWKSGSWLSNSGWK